jgi:uncharacterized membrane protein YphA (DoxX/SURF4 family)
MDLNALQTYLFLIGRVLYGGFFVLGGLNHFQHLNMMAGFTASKGVPAAKPLVLASGLLILVGGLLVIAGWHVGIGLACIVLFLALSRCCTTTGRDGDEPRINQRVNFRKTSRCSARR